MRKLVVGSLFFVLIAHTAFAGTADLVITNGDTPDPVRLGNNLTYTLVVTNKGPNQAANVVVTDVLPVGIDFLSCTPSQGSYGHDAGTVTCTLGTIANGGRATVTIVATPTQLGVFTNQVSAQTDDTDPNTGDNRANAVTTVNAANRAPDVTLPGNIILSVGASTNFAVLAIDPDHDTGVSVTNKVKPSGATFVNSNFTWSATVAFLNTTNVITFVANDNQGATNSVVTNSMTIIVPFDSDADSMSDGWEWNNFSTLTNAANDDRDGDGMDNYVEYVAGTQPTNMSSRFRVMDCATPAASTNHQVNVATEPGRKYTIYWAEGVFTNGIIWQPFASTNTGVWIETNLVSTSHMFTDTEGANTTGHAPVSGARYYKIKVGVP